MLLLLNKLKYKMKKTKKTNKTKKTTKKTKKTRFFREKNDKRKKRVFFHHYATVMIQATCASFNLRTSC